MNILRFACGAESPPYKGSFPEWVKANIKCMISGAHLRGADLEGAKRDTGLVT